MVAGAARCARGRVSWIPLWWGGLVVAGGRGGWSADERTIVGAFDHADAMRCVCPCSTIARCPEGRKERALYVCSCVRTTAWQTECTTEVILSHGAIADERGRDVLPRLVRPDDVVRVHPDRRRRRDAQPHGREMLFLSAIAAGVALSFAGAIIRVVHVVAERAHPLDADARSRCE